MGLISRLLTKNYTKIPLFYVTFDYNKFKELGKIGSCDAVTHPLIKDDDKLKQMIADTIDYIRDNYDMNKIP